LWIKACFVCIIQHNDIGWFFGLGTPFYEELFKPPCPKVHATSGGAGQLVSEKAAMKNFWILVCVLAVCAMPTGRASHAWASEEGAAPSKGEAKKGGESEGGEEKGNKAPEGVTGGRFAGDPIYVHIAPMVLPVITDQGVEQLITMQIDVEVKDFDTADKLHTEMPRVMDALMRALYGGLGQGSLRRGKLVDIAKIKAKAAAAVESVVGAENVKDVLIQGVAQRML
jgi:flagellar basal body-associated protein FliL